MKRFLQKEVEAIQFILKGQPHQLTTSLYRHLFVWTATLLFIITPLLSTDAGFNGDERFQIPYSHQLLDFYLSGGDNHSFVNNPPGETTYMKGGLFDLPSATINEILGHEQKSLAYHETRHILIGIYGVIAFIFTGLLARALAGWRAGWIALIMIALSPRFFGHSLMNPKDIPFAMAYVISAYFIVKTISSLPHPKTKHIIGMIVGIGASIGVRAGGVLIPVYFVFFALLAFIYHIYHQHNWQYDINVVRPAISRILIILGGGYLLGILFWPYALIDPISNPINAVTHVSNFHVDMPVLFNGEKIQSTNPPWYYTPHWITVTTPLLFLIGIGLFLLSSVNLRHYISYQKVGIILFMAVFPLLYIIYKNSTLYDGWRHTMFIYPPLVSLSATSWDWLYRKIRAQRIFQYLLTIGIIILLVNPLYWLIRSHPNQYVFFNPIVGGIQGAYGYYETDYWMVSVREASEWLLHHKILSNPDSSLPVIGTDCGVSAKPVLRKHFPDMKIKYTRYYDRIKKNWEYGLFYSRFVGKEQLQHNTWPPQHTIHRVAVDGVPLSIVVNRATKADYKGAEAMKSNNYKKAIRYFKKALQKDSQNESIYLSLGKSYMRTQQFKKATQAFKNCLQYYPNYNVAQYFLGNAYMKTKSYQKAITYFKRADIGIGYLRAGALYARQGNLSSAIYYLKKAIQKEPQLRQAYQMLGKIYKKKGNKAKAQQYLRAAQKLKKSR